MGFKLLADAMESDWTALKATHHQVFPEASHDVERWFVPYRLRPLGAHLDHQQGHVASIAANRGILFAYSPNAQSKVRVHSTGFQGVITIDPAQVLKPENDWADYLRGALHYLGHREKPVGIDISLHGTLGEVGLSSSAAVTLGYLHILSLHLQRPLSIDQAVVLAKRIENEFLGVQSGIGDQSAIAYAMAGHLSRYDCRKGQVTQFPQAVESQFLVVYSGYRQALTEDQSFNRRVAECFLAASEIEQALGWQGISANPRVLGDFTAADFEQVASKLSLVSRRRASHFFEEMARISAGCQAWGAGDLKTFGALMTASGESSVKNYETGTDTLIALSRFLVESEGVFGARFSGAGSRGCVIALIDPRHLDTLLNHLEAYFSDCSPVPPEAPWAFVTDSAPGANQL